MAGGFDGFNLTKYHKESRTAHRARFNKQKSMYAHSTDYAKKEIEQKCLTTPEKVRADNRVKGFIAAEKRQLYLIIGISLLFSISFFLFLLAQL